MRADALDDDGRPISWGSAVDRLARDMAGSRASPYSDRFSADWASSRWGRLFAFDRDFRRLFHDTHTALLTFRGDIRVDGVPLSPGVHLSHLDASRDARTDALSRVMDGRRYRTVPVAGAYRSGYAHLHIGVWVEGKIDESEFQPVLDAHTRHCLIAPDSLDARDGWVHVERASDTLARSDSAPDQEPVTGVARYVGANVPGMQKSGVDVDGEPMHRQKTAAILWATERRAMHIPSV